MVQFTKNPSQENWTGPKRILRYLKGTMDFALTCGGQGAGLETRAHPVCECRQDPCYMWEFLIKVLWVFS